MKRLKLLQRRLSKKKGSKNREKARLRLAKHHERIRNQRMDFLHKLSTRLVHENQGIAVECLNVSGMVLNPYLARAISGASWSRFISMLQYKCEWHGKTFIQIGRFEPSSKQCSACGCRNNDLMLSDREWSCLECGTHHDRDINAAVNIKKSGLTQVAPWEPGEGPVDRPTVVGEMKQEATNITRW